jgi:hypothetical protein
MGLSCISIFKHVTTYKKNRVYIVQLKVGLQSASQIQFTGKEYE